MAIYYVYSGAAGSGNGSSWANAFTNLTAAFVTEVAGDTLYVAHDHAESTAGLTLTSSGTVSNPTKVICVNRAGSVPPVAADRRTTATVATSGTNNLNIAGAGTHFDGIIFNCGAGTSSSAHIILHAAHNCFVRFDNCALRLLITGTGGGSLYVGGVSSNFGGCLVELNNTPMLFSGTNSGTGGIIYGGGTLRWRNTPNALTGIASTVLVVPATTAGGLIEFTGVDLSAAGSGKTLFNLALNNRAFAVKVLDCKLHASVTKSAVPIGPGGTEIGFTRSGSTGVNYTVFYQNFMGTLVEETSIVRTGGASDGTTTIAWKIDTTANCNYSMPFEAPPIAIWNDTTGSARTATVEGIWGGGAVPNDDEVWLDVEYLGDAASPLASFVNDGKANLLAAAAGKTSSSETWGGSTTKFKLAVTFTAQQKGWVYARVKCAKASTSYYIDPLVTLT